MLVLSVGASMIVKIADAGRVYTVAEVRAYLLERPSQWIGRTVRLHALLVGCPASSA